MILLAGNTAPTTTARSTDQRRWTTVITHNKWGKDGHYDKTIEGIKKEMNW